MWEFHGEVGSLILQPAARDPVPQSAHFLEHVYDKDARMATDCVIAAHDASVFVSHDLGSTWVTHDIGKVTGGRPVTRCFTLRSGFRIIQTTSEFQMFVVDQNFDAVAKCSAGKYNWHGTWSVDESRSGVIMYGEYHNIADEISVWRSSDGGLSWSRALTCRGTGKPPTEIRHFHTCQADPYQDGRWLVSSGDAAEHCRIWVSEDDGLTWKEVGEPLILNKEVHVKAPRRAYRFTSLHFCEDRIVWVTDDTLGLGQAGLVIADRLAPDKLRIAALLGRNEMRALIPLGSDLAMAISESKLDPSCAELYTVSADEKVVAMGRIPNPTGQKSAVTRTQCSKSASNGVFFSFDDTGFSGQRSRFGRWTFGRKVTSKAFGKSSSGM